MIVEKDAFAAAARQKVLWRWGPIGVFLLFNILNFLDRQLLAAAAPYLRTDFGLSNFQYGQLISAFSLTYAVAAPFVGLLIDHVGLVAGSIVGVFAWSLATVMTGFTRSFGGLIAVRMGLGLGEAGALPAASKANATYLPPAEWGLASALGSIAVTIGSVSAPLLTAVMAVRFGWRSAFIVSGALGAVWIGVWWLTAEALPARKRQTVSRRGSVLADRCMWGLSIAYSLVMVLYMFWMAWTTNYLVQERRLSAADANWYFAWIPPVFATLGGLASGALAFRWIRAGVPSVKSRMRIAWLSAPIVLISAAVPWVHSTNIAVVLIAMSLLFCMSTITSFNILPIDLFGSDNAGFTAAILASSYSLLQVFVAPLIGRIVDAYGFSAVCVIVSACPLVGVCLLQATLSSASRS
jgi:ACS family hexuronate transporter-like MFS transporter